MKKDNVSIGREPEQSPFKVTSLPENPKRLEVRRSPLEVEILIHYYCGVGDYPRDSTAFQDAIKKFVTLGIIGKCYTPGQEYVGNIEALEPYIQAICSVPLPKQQLVWAVGEVK